MPKNRPQKYRIYSILKDFLPFHKFDLEKVILRKIRSEDAQKIWEWSESVQWNEALQDIQLYVDTFPEGFLAAEFDGQIIGCTFYNHLGDNECYGGFALVEESLRGRGIGSKLLRELFKIIGDRNYGITAVAEMVQANIKIGYKITTVKIGYYHGPVRFNLKPESGVDIREYSNELFAKVEIFDRKMHKFPREKFLKSWFGRRNIHTCVAFKDGDVVGYGVLSSATRGYRIAPLYADSRDAALNIIERLAKKLPPESDIAYYVPEVNEDAMAFARSENMSLAYEPLQRQYLRWDIELPWEKVYALANLDVTLV